VCVCYGNIQGKTKKKNIAISLVEQERFLYDKGNPTQACSTLSSIGVVFMVLKKEPENVYVSHRCIYVPLMSEITSENFLFGYLKEFRGVN
jgi:hypothetical protein